MKLGNRRGTFLTAFVAPTVFETVYFNHGSKALASRRSIQALAHGTDLTAVRDNLRHAFTVTVSIRLDGDDAKRARQIGQHL